MKYGLSLFISLILVSPAFSQLIVPKIFGNHMVLQRDAQVEVWGKASPKEKITVQIHKQKISTKADKNGNWTVSLKPELQGGPFTLDIKGKKESLHFEDVYFGDVWLASGQSNMEWSVNLSMNAKEEIKNADFPLIRHIKVEHVISSIPLDDIQTNGWNTADSGSVGQFSAVAYFFAREIHQKTGVPIGIINSNWGGTNIETWISREGFESTDTFKEMIKSMPKVDLDSLGKIRVSKTAKRIEALQGSPLAPLNGFEISKSNQQDWPEVFMPQLWEEQSIGDLDGIVWLQTQFELNQIPSDSVILHLGMIDDDDSTFVNGHFVGATIGWNKTRTYAIPDSILKTGMNQLTIKVADSQGGGGLYSPKEEVGIEIGNQWLSLAGNWKFHVSDVILRNSVNAFPSLAYNGMIAPIIPFQTTGIIWYQGESNASRAYEYRESFPLLISDWRTRWNKPEWPFYFVQLATFETVGNSTSGSAWAELREAQTMTLSVPNTGMVVTTDVGNPKDIHPTNKQTVGKRLAAQALHDVYQQKQVHTGPMYSGMEIQGNTIVVSFNDVGSGLMTPNKYGYVMGFEIAGEDGVFKFAKAYIKGDKVIVYHPEIEHPKVVHFGWSGNAEDCNLYNMEGFPAVPFRTNEVKTVTKDAKYQMGW
ncbi:hypothetical protein EP331_06155 [bacterium]|nr:MAG: hypothetical protein EP331_06155 [bacterium]